MNYNTRGLRKEMARLLDKSDSWLVLRTDKQGLHMHTPEPGMMMLLVDFVSAQPELLKIINEHVRAMSEATTMDCGGHGLA